MFDPAKRFAADRPRIRRVALPLYRGMMKLMVLGRPPRVLVNSVPKAGTHLVTGLMDLLPHMRYSGRHAGLGDFASGDQNSMVTFGRHTETDWSALRSFLRQIRQGQYGTSHLVFSETVSTIIRELDLRMIFVIRDPRDVIVSSAHYLARSSRHVLHERFASMNHLGERIDAIIHGLPPTATEPGLAPIAERLRNYDPWLRSNLALTCRFEDLAGPSGGGTAGIQLGKVQEITSFINRPLEVQAARRISQRVWSSKSRTFRRGTIHEWKEVFTAEQTRAFEATAGDLLVSWGYADRVGPRQETHLS